MCLSKKLILISFLAVFLIFPIIIYGTEINWPSAPLTKISLTSDSEFHDLISYVYGWGIGIGGLLTFTMFLVAGIEWMISGGNPNRQAKAKARITSTLLGLSLLLSSWLILNTINPQLTVLSPLPPLWSDEMYEDEDILYDDSENLSCAFVVFYENPDFSGSTGEPLFPGEYKNINLLMDYQSGKGFRKMTEEEEKMLAEFGEDFFREREIYNGHIEPGPCLVTMYEEKKEGFFKKNACGKIIGATSFPNKNFAHTLFENTDKMDCFVVEDVK